MRAAVNRALLGVTGLLLLTVGAAVLAGGLDLPRHLGLTLPSWWPYRGPHDVLLAMRPQGRYRHWWPVVIGVPAAMAAGALGWLLAQLRGSRPRQLRLADGVLLRGRALEETLAAEAGAIDSVTHAAVLLTGRPTAPRARFRLTLDASADPRAVVAALDHQVLARARQSTGMTELPAEARLSGERHRARRVV